MRANVLLRSFVTTAAITLASGALGDTPQPTATASPSTMSAPGTPTPVPVPAPPYEDIIKLWRANLSEDFVKHHIETGSIVYNLSADDIVKLRTAGLPEALINTMVQTTRRTPTPAGTPAAAQPGPAVPTPSLAAQADRRWEGMVRRNSGIVLFKSRWDPGVLEFKELTLRWRDAHDSGKNVLIPAKAFTEQFLSCLKKPGGNECFEWGFKTKDTEYRFRDVSWQQGENRKVREIFDFMKAIYPDFVSAEMPVDSK
jgi:hypothetical protein